MISQGFNSNYDTSENEDNGFCNKDEYFPKLVSFFFGIGSKLSFSKGSHIESHWDKGDDTTDSNSQVNELRNKVQKITHCDCNVYCEDRIFVDYFD